MNYYQILNLSQNASHQQIKSSYKKLVKQYHPDLYVGNKEFAEQKIKEINEAYDVLSNLEKKTEYDAYLKSLEYTTVVSSAPAHSTPSTPPNLHSEDSFAKFVTEKLNQFDKKRQLQIFILFLIILLALFLVNLIQVQHYLTNQNQSSTNPSTVFNTTTNTTNNFLETNTLYSEDELKTLDDLFYELLAPYLNESYDENYTF